MHSMAICEAVPGQITFVGPLVDSARFHFGQGSNLSY